MIEKRQEPPKKEEIVTFLTKIREEYMRQKAEGKSEAEIQASLGGKIFRGGMLYIQTTSMTVHGIMAGQAATTAVAAGSTMTGAAVVGSANLLPGPAKFVLGGMIATAITGIDYRSYCKGKITKDEF